MTEKLAAEIVKKSGGIMRDTGMTSATPKPRAGEHEWRYLRSGYGSKNADFDIVSEHGGRVASTPYEDKARRIVACVNACEGIPTASLELGDTKQWIKEEITMRAERDLLREALELIACGADGVITARAALAKARP
jgi:hypothetical protein